MVVLCETRESHLTAESLVQCVLSPLNGDLGLCVTKDAIQQKPYGSLPKFLWGHDEPSNWAEQFDRSFPESLWRELAKEPRVLESGLLGGPTDPKLIGSGGIIFWYRHFLKSNLEQSNALETYDWLALVRSDFYWEVPFPDVNLLDKEKIYVLDGERYGGVSDRFMLIPKHLVIKVLSLAEDVFCNDSFNLGLLFGFNSAVEALNPETYLWLQIKKAGLTDRLVWLPYNGWSLRSDHGITRWARGEYSSLLRINIKYRDEFIRSVTNRITSRFSKEKFFCVKIDIGFSKKRMIETLSFLGLKYKFFFKLIILIRAILGPNINK